MRRRVPIDERQHAITAERGTATSESDDRGRRDPARSARAGQSTPR